MQQIVFPGFVENEPATVDKTKDNFKASFHPANSLSLSSVGPRLRTPGVVWDAHRRVGRASHVDSLCHLRTRRSRSCFVIT